jgi:hypothetical protein
VDAGATSARSPARRRYGPAIYPLVYDCYSRDILIVHITPSERPGASTTSPAIMNRMQEISSGNRCCAWRHGGPQSRHGFFGQHIVLQYLVHSRSVSKKAGRVASPFRGWDVSTSVGRAGRACGCDQGPRSETPKEVSRGHHCVLAGPPRAERMTARSVQHRRSIVCLCQTLYLPPAAGFRCSKGYKTTSCSGSKLRPDFQAVCSFRLPSPVARSS